MEEEDKKSENLAMSLDDKAENDPEMELNPLVSMIQSKFTRAEDARRTDEKRWLENYYIYRGLYNDSTKFTSTEKSKIFVKVTKTKVLAAYGMIIDVLFAGQKFPLAIEHTPEPEGVPEAVHFDPQDQKEVDPIAELAKSYGYPGDGQTLEPGSTRKRLLDRLSDSLKEKLEPVADKLKAGFGATPSSVTFHPAREAGKRMEKRIHDQLEEANASKQLRMGVFEMCLYGTGVIKGPYAEEKEYPRWKFEEGEEGEEVKAEYDPIFKTRPGMEAVSVWSTYPDPDATTKEQCEWLIQRHKMSRTDLRKLKRRPFFRHTAINEVIKKGPNYTFKWWESQLGEHQSDVGAADRFEVLEFWGMIDKTVAEEAGIKIPEEMKDLDEVQANVWVCGGVILRAVLNPFTPARIPYELCPYEINPYSIFGMGVADNMQDTQKLMNGFMRMAVDNAVLSGNLIFEIDEANLVPGQDMSIHPGKIFRRSGGAPGQALFATEYPNVAAQNMMLFDKARVLADEATFPSFAHGQTGVTGVGRTAAGISMIMGAANTGIKTVVKNVDDYWLTPFGNAYFAFNMQFDPDTEIKGDLAVKARGTDSLMRNEVRSQRYMQLLQLGTNPLVAPYLKIPEILRDVVASLELDMDRLVNDEREAVIQAETLKAMGQGMPGTAGANGQQQMAGPPGTQDMTGGGGANIGVGGAPTPGEPQFTGNPQPAPGGPRLQ